MNSAVAIKDPNHVVELSQVRNSAELQSLKKSLAYIDQWDLKITLISKITRIPVSELLAKKQTKIPSVSPVKSLGFETIFDFVTSPDSNNGLEMNWESFELSSNALYLKNKYNISSNDPSEIMLLFKDVVHKLGELPLDASAFHAVKEKVLIEQKAKVQETLEQTKAQHASELSEISGRESSLKLINSNQVEQIQKIQEQLNKTISEHDSFIHQLRIKHQQEISEKTKEVANRTRHEQELIISNLRESHSEQISAMENKILEIKAIFNEDNYVKRSRFDEVSSELDIAKGSLGTLHFENAKLKKQDEDTASLLVMEQDKNLKLIQRNADLSEQCAMLEAKIQSFGYEKFGDQFSDYKKVESDLALMTEKKNKIESYLQTACEIGTVQKARIAKLESMVKKIDQKLEVARKSIEQKKKQNQKAKNIMLLMGVVSVTTIALSFFFS